MPMYAGWGEVEFVRALERLAHKLGHHAVAESLPLRSFDGRSVALDPIKMEQVARFGNAPAHRYAPLGSGERAVLGGIGGKLVQGKADVLHGIGAEKDVRTL